MADPITNEQRNVGDSNRAFNRLERPASNPATADRGTGQVLSQEAPYATRTGPLMRMKSSAERAAQLKAARQREADLDALEKVMRAREASVASVAGGAMARSIHGLHQEKVQKGKRDGIGFGVEWLANQAYEVEKKKGKEARDRFLRERLSSLQGRGLGMFSCLTMMDGPMQGYALALRLGADEPNAPLVLEQATTRAADARGTGEQEVFGGRGTVLLEELRKNMGFETVHVDTVRDKTKYSHPKDYTSDADVRRTRAVPTNPNTKKVIGADSGKPIDVHVRVEHFIKLGKRPSVESRDLFESLKRLEFAVGVADSGLHTFALSGGMVYEVHWNKGPKDPKLTSAKPLEDFLKEWGSAVIAVPPGELNKPVTP